MSQHPDLATPPAMPDLSTPAEVTDLTAAPPVVVEEPPAVVEPERAVARVPVAVVDVDQTTRSRLAMQLGTAATPYPTLESLLARLNGQPTVVLLGPSCAGGAELSQAESMIHEHPETAAVLVASELSTTLLQTALRAGIKDVLALPVDTGQLQGTIERVAATLSGVPRLADGGPPLGAPAGEPGRTMTVFSTKGGAGTSMLATNMAVLLARQTDRPVVLVDADLQFGDVAVMLKLAPQHTIVDAVSGIDRIDAGMLESLLVTHEPSGLLVLPAPLEPAFADQISGSAMVRILDLLRSFAAYVVVDTPAYFNDVVLGTIEASDDLLLVAGMDIPNIKNAKIGLQTLAQLNVPMSKVRLILNRANSKVKLEVSEVEKTLQVKADALVPSDIVVPQSVNKGTPVVLGAPKSGVARALRGMTAAFVSANESAGS